MDTQLGATSTVDPDDSPRSCSMNNLCQRNKSERKENVRQPQLCSMPRRGSGNASPCRVCPDLHRRTTGPAWSSTFQKAGLGRAWRSKSSGSRATPITKSPRKRLADQEPAWLSLTQHRLMGLQVWASRGRTLTVCSPGWETSIVGASISENLSHDPVAEGFSSTVPPATSTTAKASPDSAAIKAVTLYSPGCLNFTFQEADSSDLSQNPIFEWPSFSSTLIVLPCSSASSVVSASVPDEPGWTSDAAGAASSGLNPRKFSPEILSATAYLQGFCAGSLTARPSASCVQVSGPAWPSSSTALILPVTPGNLPRERITSFVSAGQPIANA